ncbi:hypothetical protein [Methylomonas koyamae]|uniref:hypothetical protein n=1 Tax=Methylomonas koyamae TaxID=702114 RepID=UPI0006D27C54|nr:hypothetical protein [Methylomonas koyamae]
MTQEAVLDDALKNADALGQALAVVKKNGSDSVGQNRQDATSLLGKGEPSAASAADAGLAQAVSGQNAAGQGTQDNASNEPAAEPMCLRRKAPRFRPSTARDFRRWRPISPSCRNRPTRPHPLPRRKFPGI